MDSLTPEQDARLHAVWRKRNSYYYSDIAALYGFLVYPGSKVLELGCGQGELLESLRAKRKCTVTGIERDPSLVRAGKKRHPQVRFVLGDVERVAFTGVDKGPYDVIILSDLVGHLRDIQAVLERLRAWCSADTRVVLNTHNFLWEPMLRASRRLGLASPVSMENWLSVQDLTSLLSLTGFDVVKQGTRMLFPKRIPLVSWFVNRYVAPLPLLNKLCLYQYIVARPLEIGPRQEKSVTVVIPARNEKGNIEKAVLRTPKMGTHTEIIFIEGGSSDGTWEEIKRVAAKYRGTHSIRYTHQEGSGKGDAVRKAFDMARGDVLMILDADLTVPPEDLPKFYRALVSGRGEFINGTRLVYPMEKEAMRTLNRIGNKAFSVMFTWLLGQRFKDTLCGTKVLSAANYARLKKNRLYFGDFDPFGDFDLIFGAAKLNLKIVEIPIRYKERTYGSTNIQRFKHGWLLIKMCAFAMRKIKFVG